LHQLLHPVGRREQHRCAKGALNEASGFYSITTRHYHLRRATIVLALHVVVCRQNP